MSEILLLNPRQKKRRAKKTTRKRAARKTTPRRRTRTAAKRKPVARKVTKKGAYSMAKRKRRSPRKRRAPRRNPSPARRARRSISTSSRASSLLSGLNFTSALKNVPVSAIGMFAAKWAAKKFGDAATETDPTTWNYASYLKGAAGAAIAGFIANKLKRGSGQKVLEGGMSLMLYKLVQNELIAPTGTSFWSTQFGATNNNRVPGVIEENSEGEPYILGDDLQWYPLEGADDYRMEPELYGDTLVEPGPLGLGDALIEPGPLGASTTELDRLYRGSFINR